MDLYNASLGEEEPEEITLTLEQYEEAKDHCKGLIALGDAAKRLADNPDFKSLILQGYLENEPKRLAELMASGRLNNPVTVDSCKQDILAVGSFRNYMKSFVEQGNSARDELAMLEEARHKAILAEEAANAVAG